MSTIAVNRIETTAGAPLLEVANGQAYGVFAPVGMRNRIINGDMRIDQRNAGAAVTVNAADLFFAVDRTLAYGSNSAGVFTAQRSAVAPQGFTNSLLCTVTTASTPSGGNEYGFRQNIEGFNTADLGWGSASAQSVNLSFLVRSSVTGTFAGSVSNNGYDRSYVFTYTVSTANTWEQKTVTIPGDVAGTWLTNNGTGIRLQFNLGAGSSKTGTAGVWGAGYLQSATGSVNIIATTGATFYITGVQLEAGSVATPFERRPYGTELALCQRYFENVSFSATGAGRWTTRDWTGYVSFAVTKRVAPTMSFSGTFQTFANGNQGDTTNVLIWTAPGLNGFSLRALGGSNQDAAAAIINQNTGVVLASSEL